MASAIYHSAERDPAMVSERIPRLHELADEELMAQYARGEEAGFEILLHRYKRPLFGFLYRYLGRADKAEDVFQDVFYEVIRARKRFRPNQKFAHWVFRIARNRAVDRLRRNRFREMPSLDDFLETEGQGGHTRLNAVAMRGADPEELTQALELEEALEEALATLPPEQSEVFWLKEKSGLTLAEIAQMVGVTENTVKSRLRYALEKIRTTMMQKGFLP